MSQYEKIIKHIATALALLLSVVIISFTVKFILMIGDALISCDSGPTKSVTLDYTNVKSLHIDNSFGKVTIMKGSSFQIVALNVSEKFAPSISDSGLLTVKSTFSVSNWIGKNANFENSDITIYVPEAFTLDQISIDCNFGDIVLDSISTKRLVIDAGAGTIEGSNILAESCDIHGGMGDISFHDVAMSDANFDLGVGDFDLKGLILGRSKIHCGMGDVTMTLQSSLDDYNIRAKTGLGDLYIDGKEYSKINWKNINAKYSMDINGGLGDLDIHFNN